MGQLDSTHEAGINKRRLTVFATTGVVAYTGTMVALSHIWFSGLDREPFHFFNDAAEWKQVDKVGHFYSSFYLSAGTYEGLRWSNVSEKKSMIIGSLTGFLVLSSVEWFDGRSAGYGASLSDLVADFGGSAFYLGQKAAWGEIRLRPKFSFHFTDFAAQRPALLGSGYEEIIKDYNGQTYWISWNPHSLLRMESWPKWLNIAVGYGAQNMISARDESNRAAGLHPIRQYYLSLDINADELRVRSKALRAILSVTRLIKIPAPTIELSSDGFRVRPFYF